MTLSLHPEKLKRYKDIASLLLRYGYLHNGAADREEMALREDAQEATPGDPEKLVGELEELGPTFIKLGQLLSTRPDFLPEPYLQALSRLQDDVEPFSFGKVKEIVEVELGVAISRAFASFEEKPVAAASLGQVHLAMLRDGRPVAVKVQRPGIREQIMKDLDALNDLAETIDKHTEAGRRYTFQNILKEFRKSLLRELNYEEEAQNLEILANHLADFPRLMVPMPVRDYVTSRVLTMDYVRGRKITQISPLARLEFDGKVLADDLCRAYLEQILAHGFFHADPHPGNIFLTEDHRLAFLDLGMVARLDDEMREMLLKLLVAISEGRGHEAARLSLEIGTPLHDADRETFIRAVVDIVVRSRDARVQDMQTGRILMDMVRISSDCAIRPAPDLSLLGKTLLSLDGIARTLDPEFDPTELVRRETARLMQHHLMERFSPKGLFSTFLEAQELARKLPSRLDTLLEALTNREFEIRVNAFDQTLLLRNLQKIGNRITMGLILAALIVGAAMMMRVKTDFTILGYPGIAILLFLLAAACGFFLVFSILLRDAEHRRPPRE